MTRLAHLLFIVVLFISCEEEKIDQLACLMPIKTGNSWSYTSTTLFNNGQSTNNYKYTIGEKIEINGNNCYVIQTENTLGVSSLIKKDENGTIILFGCASLIGNDNYGNVVRYGGISDVDTLIIPSIEYKKNAQVGDEWVCSIVSMDWNSETFIETSKSIRCLSLDTLINTPKGDFHCMAFETPGNSSNQRRRYYYSINVGEIRNEILEGGIIRFYTELIDYTINK